MPRPDFPSSFPEFLRRFQSEEACFEFLLESRWPEGFRCPACGSMASFRRGDRLAIACRGCKRFFSATAGTVMDRTRQPLSHWLIAAWLLTTSKRGLSALELQRQMGLKFYEPAYHMLQKMRRAMVAPGRSMLGGRVEVDETYIGGPEPGARGRGALGKALVVGAVEVRDRGAGRVRLRVIARANAHDLHKFVRENVEEGATLVTDGSPSYDGLYGYKRIEQIVGQAGLHADDVLPRFHTMVGNLKAWLLGTHHGAVREKHLQAYLDEFVFRFNRRGNLKAAFQTLLGLTPRAGTLTYHDVYGEPAAPRATRRKARASHH